MQPSSLRAFQRHQEHDLKHPGSVDLIITIQNNTKQNKLPSFIDKYGDHFYIKVHIFLKVGIAQPHS
jgi:hypothetical protein